MNLEGPTLRYATLTHRWVLHGTVKLLRENKEAFRERIDPDSLSLVFQEAIDAARRLDIRYLWIDALCIVQDDANDWQRESALMGQVYHSTSAFMLIPTIVHYNMFGNFYREQLTDRGWVLQERLLSPRSVYFSKILKWECAEMSASETYPEGNVQTYSSCNLTYASDTLPAISGLAKCFGDVLQDRYFAGIWGNDLLRGLLWSALEKAPYANEQYVGKYFIYQAAFRFEF
ncbi:HET-domain-containing protein [Byssothecium circinans]|uniref:HET-domain-containing protein n=1 Tax=Byssothecium circinans TaxID=147558 RepID=A0A6A5UFQ6_9PLEO|nr:HET-domain-containing protein [Byssothecium circinans]